MSTTMEAPKVIRIVFFALLLDIIAFTIILPLFPRLVAYYVDSEKHLHDNTLLKTTLRILQDFRNATGNKVATHPKWDSVLLGGALGSLFSFCQFIASPIIGAVSDRKGRRYTMLLTMVGNIASCLIWMFSKSFGIFVLSRVVGGLSEGNVQLSISIISDITTEATRSKGLMYVGIAFAISFTIGPALGAAFAKLDLSKSNPGLLKYGLNPYSAPAMFTLFLLVVETLFIYVALPETSGVKESEKEIRNPKTVSQRRNALSKLAKIHLAYLFLFSGMEFTLTFLTFDILDYSNMQNGKLLGYVGILSALLQGGYIRRRVDKVGEAPILRQGLMTCLTGLVFIALVPLSKNYATTFLYLGATCLAFASATVVNCLTALGTKLCDKVSSTSDPNTLPRGLEMGRFRSKGQLGRCLGPVFACSIYWTLGPSVCYGIGAAGLFVLLPFTVNTLKEATALKVQAPQASIKQE